MLVSVQVPIKKELGLFVFYPPHSFLLAHLPQKKAPGFYRSVLFESYAILFFYVYLLL